MDFSQALKTLKMDNRVRRTAWRPGAYIELQLPDSDSKMTLPYIFMRNAFGAAVPWTAPHEDLLAEDWMLSV